MIDLFVIDDHPMMIAGISSLFEDGSCKIKVVGSANMAKEAHALLWKSTANIILLDLRLPGMSGVEFAAILKRDFPQKKIIVLTGELNAVVLYNSWINNVDAILMKNCGKNELIDTIHAVMAGRRVIGKDVPKFQYPTNDSSIGKSRVTPSEKRVLKLLAKRCPRIIVSEVLGISENAVDFHCKNLFIKFKCNTESEIVEAARLERLIEV